MLWTVLNAVVVEAETQTEADRKAFAWFQSAPFDGLVDHRMCGHPMTGNVVGCPCSIPGRDPTGMLGLIQGVPTHDL